ncbi:disease resistance protein RGA2-like isoform X2 [Magnolia sinica]|uniref:disease resistance protein RGA2-like isoform X2 n=1 Tax=Magnolia sinica TaxID=86752 RepID=UPI002658ECD9|nr:disease resistance protein RGA2-like isoform X2 [Magnolia sinica]
MVDSVVSLAVEKLNTVLRDEVALLVGVTNEIEKLSRTFALIQAVLEDAESRRVKDKAVTIWLENVKDVAYDVDDILDEWITEDLKSQAPDEDSGSCFSKKKVRSFLSSVNCFNHVVLRHKIGSRIKEVRGRLDSIEKEKSRLGLIVYCAERERMDSEVRQREMRDRETSSLPDQLFIVGRGDEKKVIVDSLLGGSSGEVKEVPLLVGESSGEVKEVPLLVGESSGEVKEVPLLLGGSRGEVNVPLVISIVGMGGLGKTTLAQLTYNDEKVKGHFHPRMWVYVSQDFDVKRITESIIKSADTKFKGGNLNLNELQTHLREMLRAKRFLLVLDDIWSDDSEKWDKLRLPFQDAALGSRIIITTRNEKVAFAMGTAHTHNLAALSDDDCWLVFRRKAFEHRNAEERLALETIGREIVNKCGGVPLAAKTIGSAMCSRSTREEWELVLRDEIWNSGDVLGGVLPALLLSYHDLSPVLKECFSYFSIFPKGFVIEKDMMVKLWVAQGFIGSDLSSDMEKSGGLYFNDLLRRSLLQDAEPDDDGNIRQCKMHDLVHDLAQSVAGSDFSLVHIGKKASLNFNNVRHSLLSNDETVNEADEVAYISATLYKAHKLRTLFLESTISMVPRMSFHHWRRLRALDLSYTSIEKLSPTVGHLKHLRFLDLSWTGIEELPEEVCNCLNLQTLRLNYCDKLRKLPRGMKKLISLKHLELEGTDMLEYLPQGIGRLSSLRTVSKFIVGGGNEGCKCGELKHLNHLQGSLLITGLDKNRSRDEAREAELNKKQHLHTLSFNYKKDYDELLDEEVKKIEDVLEFLQPHTNLKELAIQYYGGSTLPKWIEDPVFSHLVRMTLSCCWECIQLPGFGKLPSLKYLEIEGMREVRKVGVEFSGVDNNDGSGCVVSFPKLETLVFINMPNWEEWELRGGVGEVMPSLLQLEVKWCPKLKELPTNLPPLLQKLSLQISNEGMLSLGGTLPVLPNLKHLIIWRSDELKSFPCGWLGQFKALKTLEIHWCRELESLPDEELQQLTMLQELIIQYCPLLKERYGDEGEDRHKIAQIPDKIIY